MFNHIRKVVIIEASAKKGRQKREVNQMKSDNIVMQQNLLGAAGTFVQVREASHVSIGKHSHDFYELVFVREGFCMHHLGDSASLAMEGDLLMIKPGMHHKYTGSRECKIYNCLFTEEAFGASVWEEVVALPGMPLMLLPSEAVFPHMHLDMAERRQLSELLGRMSRECSEEKSGWSLKSRAMLYELMVECSRIYEVHSTKQPEKELYPNYVTKALRYIDEHHTEDTLTVQQLGEQVGVSGDYLSRQFRKITGVTVQEYIRRFRLSRGITFLQEGYSVGEAARRSGFHSIAYFSREFKKELGVSPSHYDKR